MFIKIVLLTLSFYSGSTPLWILGVLLVAAWALARAESPGHDRTTRKPPTTGRAGSAAVSRHPRGWRWPSVFTNREAAQALPHATGKTRASPATERPTRLPTGGAATPRTRATTWGSEAPASRTLTSASWPK